MTKSVSPSSYPIDQHYQGYGVGCRAWTGRCLSIIDIPAQGGKILYTLVKATLLFLMFLVKAIVSLVFTIISIVFWVLTLPLGLSSPFESSQSYMKEKMFEACLNGLQVLVDIPLFLLQEVGKILGNVFGILLPEVGRKSRLFSMQFLDVNFLTTSINEWMYAQSKKEVKNLSGVLIQVRELGEKRHFVGNRN
jgi:hypothetical protein